MNYNCYFTLLLCSLILPVHLCQAQDIEISIEGPRNFGYRLGDTLRLTAVINVPAFYKLDTDNLPQPGPVNSWLLLDQLTIDTDSRDDYRLKFAFQLFKKVPNATRLSIPALPIRFYRGGSTMDAEIPAWPFSYSPFLPATPAEWEIQPLQSAPLVESGSQYQLLSGMVIGITLLAFYLAWFYGKLSFLERYSGHFGLACKKLRTLTGKPSDPNACQQALLTFHHALNAVAGETVYYEQLPDFFRKFPAYQPAKKETEAVFELSRQLFFSANPPQPDIELLKSIEALCQLFRKIERSVQWR